VELSWLMRLRITAAVAAGVVLIGILGWPLAAPPEPFGAVLAGNLSFAAGITLAALAFLAGFIGYFVSWPYGRQIGILAVPSGLAVWAVRCGDMAGVMQLNPVLAQRQGFLGTLKWEPVFWLAIVTVGFAGVLVGQKIAVKPRTDKNHQNSNSKSNLYLNVIIALVGSVLIAQFCIGLLAQDVRIPDPRLGSVVAQPAIGQIVFAVLVSFGIAGFVVKKFLNVSYIWPTVASAFVTAFVISAYVKQDILRHLAERYPAVFFSNAASSIFPVQMVAFGALGSIAGYWLAVRYNYWRKHA